MDKHIKRKSPYGMWLYLLGLILVFALFAAVAKPEGYTPERLSYTQLLSRIEAGIADDPSAPNPESISDVILKGQTLYGRTYGSEIPAERFGNSYDFSCVVPGAERFYADVRALYAAALGRDVLPTEYRFTITTQLPQDNSFWLDWAPVLLSVVLLGAFLFIMFRRQGGGGQNNAMMNFGRSRAQLHNPDDHSVKFTDVAGVEEEKDELREIVDFLKDPQKYTRLGARIPTGVLLIGPPGTGKTLLARAVAGEAGVPFFLISGSDFMEMFVGVGAARVRDLFEQAKKRAPAIVFIDEIDAVGRQRGTGLGGGHDEREQTLNQLLVEMDGFTQNPGVIVMAATNRADILDPALMRPGRFDRRIHVGYPDVTGREAILKVHARNKPLADEVDLTTLAKRTPYFTGADLMNVMNEAALLAARENLPKITMQQVEEAITRVMTGPEKKSRHITDEDRRLVAYHEGGHAIVDFYIPECDDVHEITIIPRGEAGGYTMVLPQKEIQYVTTARLCAQMASAMGGRVAEALIFGDVSTGASSDLKHATQIARAMVAEYGMSNAIGPMFLRTDHEVFLGRSLGAEGSAISESLNAEIDAEVQRLLREAYARAEQILTDHRDQLDGLAALLLEKEKLTADDFKAFMSESRA